MTVLEEKILAIVLMQELDLSNMYLNMYIDLSD